MNKKGKKSSRRGDEKKMEVQGNEGERRGGELLKGGRGCESSV